MAKSICENINPSLQFNTCYFFCIKQNLRVRLYSPCRGSPSQAPHGKSLPELCFALLLSHPRADCNSLWGLPRNQRERERSNSLPPQGTRRNTEGLGFALTGLILPSSAFTGCFCSPIRTPDCKDLAEAELGLTHSPHLGSEAQRQANHLQATVLVCSMPPSIFRGYQSQN